MADTLGRRPFKAAVALLFLLWGLSSPCHWTLAATATGSSTSRSRAPNQHYPLSADEMKTVMITFNRTAIYDAWAQGPLNTGSSSSSSNSIAINDLFAKICGEHHVSCRDSHDLRRTENGKDETVASVLQRRSECIARGEEERTAAAVQEAEAEAEAAGKGGLKLEGQCHRTLK